MILHSIEIGIRRIHVRTDNCGAQELKRVHETVWLVEHMLNPQDKWYGLLMGVVAYLVSMVITQLTMSPGPAQVIIPLAALVIVSVVSWRLVVANIHHYQLVGTARLTTLTMASTRCRDFVIECTEASPVLSRALGDLATRPQTA